MAVIIAKYPNRVVWETGEQKLYAGVVFWHNAEGAWLRVSGTLSMTDLFCGAFTIVMVSFQALVGLLKHVPAKGLALKAFGQGWVEWAQSVPCMIIPEGLYSSCITEKPIADRIGRPVLSNKSCIEMG